MRYESSMQIDDVSPIAHSARRIVEASGPVSRVASQRRAAIAHSARRAFEAQPPVSRVASQRRAAIAHSARRAFEAQPPVSRVASQRRAASLHKAGFTLLEVLAAVAILGIAYIALGSSGIQGLQHEGEARRRFQASLLADSVLAEIEAELEAGVAPELGTDEREADDFKIEVEIAAYSFPMPEEEDKDGKRLGNARSRLGGSDAQAQQPAIPGPSLLGGESGPGAVSPLRRIDVRILWNEGFGERIVSRTTFALDPEAAGPTLAAIAQAQAAAAGQQPQQPNAPNPLGGENPGTIGTPQ
jgi:prepilin-type N-terminal cleavage/methylation domain-containing protein